MPDLVAVGPYLMLVSCGLYLLMAWRARRDSVVLVVLWLVGAACFGMAYALPWLVRVWKRG